MDYTKVISTVKKYAFAIVNELGGALDDIATKIKQETDAIKTDVAGVKTDVGVVDNKVTTLDTTLTSMDSKIDKVGVDAEKAANRGGFDLVSDGTEVPADFSSTKILITSADLPNCEIIDTNAFYNVVSLSKVYAPKLKTIGASAFKGSSIASVDFLLCETVGERAFEGCKKLKSVNLPKAKTVSDYAFNESLVDKNSVINLPLVENVGDYAFKATYLKNLYLPNCIEAGQSAFDGMGYKGDNGTYSTNKIHLPKLRVLYRDVLGHTRGKTYDFGNLVEIKDMAMHENSVKDTDGTCVDNLIIRTNSVCVLQPKAFNASTSTGWKAQPPLRIYVPDNLVSQYQTATNWSTYANRIKPLSQYVEV